MLVAVLTWIGIGVGALLLLILFVPFGVRASGLLNDATIAGTVELRWLLGALALRWSSEEPDGLLLLGRRVARWPRRREAPRPPARRRGRRRGLRWLLRSRAALGRVLGRLLGAARLRLEVRGRIGLDDPAETALLVPAVAQLERLPAVHLELGWDWLEETLELEGQATARLWVVQLIAVALLLLLDGEVRRMVRAPA